MSTKRNHYKKLDYHELERSAGELNLYLKSAPEVDRLALERDARMIARALRRKQVKAMQRLDVRSWAAQVAEQQRAARDRDLSQKTPSQGQSAVGAAAAPSG